MENAQKKRRIRNMKQWKKTLGIAASVAAIVVVGATFFSVAGTSSGDVLELRLAHNQAAGSEIAGSIAKISDFVAEDPSQKLKVSIYASGVLGTEKEEIEMVQAGVLDMAKVSSNTLGQFKDEYSIFAVPYLFQSQEHYYVACTDPSVLKGKKIRSMPSSTSMDMIELMGGSPVPMAGGETYSACLQGESSFGKSFP